VVIDYGGTHLPRSLIFQISGLPDRSLLEIEQDVNSGWENGSFERYLLETEKI
jgi:hypothetical protein